MRRSSECPSQVDVSVIDETREFEPGVGPLSLHAPVFRESLTPETLARVAHCKINYPDEERSGRVERQPPPATDSSCGPWSRTSSEGSLGPRTPLIVSSEKPRCRAAMSVLEGDREIFRGKSGVKKHRLPRDIGKQLFAVRAQLIYHH